MAGTGRLNPRAQRPIMKVKPAHHPDMPPRLSLALALAMLLAGCDQLKTIPGLGPDPRIAQREEEAKAIGGACRHAGRAIEDCYTLNKKAEKASVFAGWREMNDYMRENKIEEVVPQIAHPRARRPVETAEAAETPPEKKRRAE